MLAGCIGYAPNRDYPTVNIPILFEFHTRSNSLKTLLIVAAITTLGNILSVR